MSFKIHQHPFGFALPFDAQRANCRRWLAFFDHLVGQRFDLAGGGTAGDHHQIGETGDAAHIQDFDVLGFDFFQGVHNDVSAKLRVAWNPDFSSKAKVGLEGQQADR
jgi:hypothetical protein